MHINDLIRAYSTLSDDAVTDATIRDLRAMDDDEAWMLVRPAVKRQVLDVRREENRAVARGIRRRAARDRAASGRPWVSGVRMLALERLEEFLGNEVTLNEGEKLLADTMSPADWGRAAHFNYVQAEDARGIGQLYESVEGTLLALHANSIVEALQQRDAA